MIHLKCNFVIEANYLTYLLVKDVGPWDKYKSITNDVENLVEFLYERGMLHSNKVFEYIDSEGEKCRIQHLDGKFVSFSPSIN